MNKAWLGCQYFSTRTILLVCSSEREAMSRVGVGGRVSIMYNDISKTFFQYNRFNWFHRSWWFNLLKAVVCWYLRIRHFGQTQKSGFPKAPETNLINLVLAFNQLTSSSVICDLTLGLKYTFLGKLGAALGKTGSQVTLEITSSTTSSLSFWN